MSDHDDFTPHPGSRLAMAGRSASPLAGLVALEQAQLPAAPDMTSVPVRPERPAGTVLRTSVIAASGIRQLLPQDAARWRAVIIAIDEDVILCATKDLASDAANTASTSAYPQGFYLPKGLPGVVLEGRGLVWAANTSTSASTRVSVAVERHEDPSPLGQ